MRCSARTNFDLHLVVACIGRMRFVADEHSHVKREEEDEESTTINQTLMMQANNVVQTQSAMWTAEHHRQTT